MEFDAGLSVVPFLRLLRVMREEFMIQECTRLENRRIKEGRQLSSR